MKFDCAVVSCEHGGNRVPRRYEGLFAGAGAVLATHRGYDIGALPLARRLARALDAPLFGATTTRLVVDLNRSPSNPRRFSEWTRRLPREERDRIDRERHAPYRDAVERVMRAAVAAGGRVLHVSVHSFTPSLDGEVRNADVGLLYDPSRRSERSLAGAVERALANIAPSLRVRRNYPYLGVADGICAWLRERLPRRYVPLELELNQMHVGPDGRFAGEIARPVEAALLRAIA